MSPGSISVDEQLD
ncbi:hypothetical protein WG8_3401 [Paenibacillus sp. Aloe-11]|nr:hypothetical protein WG8_3401 [Paenibacillus sp. Aloe-11]